MNFIEHSCLSHHGILGMKWGIRRYQNKDGSLTAAGRKHYGVGGSGYDKDFTLSSKRDVLTTLSSDPNRTKNVDMFYASVTPNDKKYYKAFFSTYKDTNLKNITKPKLQINNKLAKNVKVASEQSGAKVISDLYNKDENFKDFIVNKERMASLFPANKKFLSTKPEYRKALVTLNDVTKKGYASEAELKEIYKIFNYILPNDGRGDESAKQDVEKIRNSFFSALKEQGYGAVLDTNDAYYGNYGTSVERPVIMFDMEQVVPSDVKQLKMSEIKKTQVTESIKRLYREVTHNYV